MSDRKLNAANYEELTKVRSEKIALEQSIRALAEKWEDSRRTRLTTPVMFDDEVEAAMFDDCATELLALLEKE